MLSLTTVLAFTAVAVGMVLTPGPNMAYLVSRSICQGRLAGLISLIGVVTGFVIYMLLAAFGITALLFAVPYAYDALRIAGAAYLAWMAWQALKPGGRSPFEVRALKPDSVGRLYGMGLFTSLLNPKIAALYLSLLPQFVDHSGPVLGQTLQLGLIQILVSAFFNACFVVMAGTISAFLAGRPLWTTIQRWLMGTVLMGLAARMALDSARR
ncbi:LysE family translocator [Labrys neptuniae]|uniref:LysE family translocator n=1 Tax=Labrys neptuniae TaxID=376174 RepID=A0ABV3PVQ2_9HYPH|nr:LysE family translocator [Labrys neptuniae]MDT3377242.1 LysE family translocator [Labrys neptuniae]